MRKIVATLLLSALPVVLGGCQSVFSHAPAAGASRADADTIDMADYFAARLVAGRIHLRRNRPTQAVTAFRQASYDARHSAEAYNGMAVAYARLGRPDLAARYFDKAVSADPADERFARNLARLSSAQRQSPPRALAHVAGSLPAPAPRSTSPSDEQSMAARVHVEAPSTRFVRLSSREVRLVSAPTTTRLAQSQAPMEYFIRSRRTEARAVTPVSDSTEIALADMMARTLFADPVQVASAGLLR